MPGENDDASPANDEGPMHSTSVILNIADGIDANGDAADISPGKRARLDALADAEHLDALESSEAVTDIASFQDIELPPPVVPSGTTEGSSSIPPESFRKAKKFYYCLPMMQKYYVPILGCLLAAAMIATAIGLVVAGAESGRWDDDVSSPQSQGGGGGGGMKIDDAPPQEGGGGGMYDGTSYQDPYTKLDDVMAEEYNIEDPTQEWYDDQVDEELGDLPGEDGVPEGDEELGDSHEATGPTDPPTDAPRPDSSSQGMSPITARPPVPAPPAPSAPSGSTSGGNDSTDPVWYEKIHEAYQQFLQYNVDGIEDNMPELFCNTQSMTLCSYHDYCPFGRGNKSFAGGPPGIDKSNELKRDQWAPFALAGGQDGIGWVQVGQVPEVDGGDEEDNGMGTCYRMGEWKDLGHVAKSGTWGATQKSEHHRWILCCPEDGR